MPELTDKSSGIWHTYRSFSHHGRNEIDPGNSRGARGHLRKSVSHGSFATYDIIRLAPLLSHTILAEDRPMLINNFMMHHKTRKFVGAFLVGPSLAAHWRLGDDSTHRKPRLPDPFRARNGEG
jgi:hypothetical protein